MFHLITESQLKISFLTLLNKYSTKVVYLVIEYKTVKDLINQFFIIVNIVY